MQPKDDTKLSDAAIAACAIIAEHMPEPDPTPIIESGETLVVVSTTELDGTEVKPRKTTVEPVNVMSKKAKALYTSLDGRGVDWRKLRQGINPLRVMGLEGPKDVGPNFMHLTVKMLLEQGSFTTRELQAAFVSEFGWGVSTASSHVSIVNSLLTYAGAVTLEEGKMTRVTE